MISLISVDFTHKLQTNREVVRLDELLDEIIAQKVTSSS